MATVPRDLADLYLAPVALALDNRIRELAALSGPDLAKHIALVSNRLDWSRDERETAMLVTVADLLDLHGWTLDWVERGLEMSRGANRLVLGVPQTFRDYVDGDRATVRT